MRQQRILVLVPAGAVSDLLHRTVRSLAADLAAHVLVVMPQPRRPFAGDASLLSCVRRLHAFGLAAEGRMGAPDSIRALADALDDFDATELVIADSDLVDLALARFGLPTVAVAPAAAALAAAA